MRNVCEFTKWLVDPPGEQTDSRRSRETQEFRSCAVESFLDIQYGRLAYGRGGSLRFLLNFTPGAGRRIKRVGVGQFAFERQPRSRLFELERLGYQRNPLRAVLEKSSSRHGYSPGSTLSIAVSIFTDYRLAISIPSDDLPPLSTSTKSITNLISGSGFANRASHRNTYCVRTCTCCDGETVFLLRAFAFLSEVDRGKRDRSRHFQQGASTIAMKRVIRVVASIADKRLQVLRKMFFIVDERNLFRLFTTVLWKRETLLHHCR